MINISSTKLYKAATRELLLVLTVGVLIPTFCLEMLVTLWKSDFILSGGTLRATPNGPACCWWLLAVLPIDPRYQLSVLSMTSLKERLVKIQQILTYLQSIPNN